ncbi:hypothetical protein F5Y01DRAFT_327529 [Xylaria sp. FL0043]|nr:hypothetical protein F5Y01DRAFT_327529 [Xylaria sp. FL0043]
MTAKATIPGMQSVGCEHDTVINIASSPTPDESPNKTADEAYAIDPNLCGNCGSDDHKAAVCAKLEKSGWMEACCKCDSLQHTYEHCPLRLSEEDFEYLILNRGNKAPVKCSLHLGRVVLLELGRNASPFHDYDIIALPHSAIFSRQLAGGYVCWETQQDRDGNAVELPRYNQPLGRAVSILRDQRWTIEDHEIDRAARPCENCYSRDHSIYQCLHWCGFCGCRNHPTWSCESIDKACFCCKYPAHDRSDCDDDCWYCSDVQGKDGYHCLDSCPKICHYCLGSDHVTGMCEVAMKATKRACSICPEETYHYPLMHMICPGANCKKLIKTSPCEEHCLLEKAGLPKHECQWTSAFWSRAKSGVSLTCKKDASHCQPISSQLVSCRLGALSTLLGAAAAGNKNISQPLECQQCQTHAESQGRLRLML